MRFLADKGGWIADCQLQGTWSPGAPQINRNLKMPVAAADSPAQLEEEAKCAPFCSHTLHSPAAVLRTCVRAPAVLETVGECALSGRYRAAIKISPTDQFVQNTQADNPFALPAYWDADASRRGWYAKPGEAGNNPKSFY
jgi:hypothetical protein